MPSLTIMRAESGFARRVFYAKHKSKEDMGEIYELLLTNKVLVGGDRVICKHGKKVTHDYRLCITCQMNPQTKDKEYCEDCAPKKKLQIPVGFKRGRVHFAKAIRDYAYMSDILEAPPTFDVGGRL